ncbi:hypothetical protein ACLMAJ_29690 [Nocardia sp. KC 131]|uniref:hypothetical protein n=1 Tax=Nocardia arseniciresistens TaxID=3392119 RepID=UPI00398F8B4E
MTPPPDQVFYIMSQVMGTDQPLVLGVQGDGMQPGTSVVLWPLETTDAQSQLWTATPTIG